MSWGLTLQERSDIDQQRHQVALDHVRNFNEIEDLRSRGSPEEERRSPMDVVLRPSKLQIAITTVGVLTALFFLARNLTNEFQSLPWTDEQQTQATVQAVIPVEQPVIPVIAEAPEIAYEPIAMPLKLSASGDKLEAVSPQEKEANLTHVSRISIKSFATSPSTEIVVQRLKKEDAPPGPQSVVVLRNRSQEHGHQFPGN